MPLTRAIASVEHPEYVESREEIESELAHSWMQLDEDSLLALDARTGDPLAWGLVVAAPGSETLVRSILLGGVHPAARGRGLGRALLNWQDARAQQQLATHAEALPAWSIVYADDRSSDKKRLLEGAGFTATRWFLGQERVIADPIPEVPFDDGVSIVPFTTELSEATRLAKSDAFRDHWGSQPTTREQWDAMLALPVFRPDLSFVAVDRAGSVVGLVMTETSHEDWELQGYSSGYITLVGVVREWRRRGIAPALLARVFHALADAGIERAALDVDSVNPTGALGLYSGMGFHTTTTVVAYTREF